MTVLLRCLKHKKYEGINNPKSCAACVILFECRRVAARACLFDLYIAGDRGPKRKRKKHTLEQRAHLSRVMREKNLNCEEN